ncbi:DUF11 domain-containing protein [Sphingorhabdus pulchriflava]|uniref:DUF11 domain-containing protein n=1 Tax=Sphingorhabdus pulchriflava TaxID=2292257 RepID=A0A371B561_9SPHN|nr:proprotein convertase P-domain-containing protein [Sphingorhabdus pulchriflava]RDV02647.1 DUF11 domain-containing protein [Sphingorhabdus pulchriflava]
MSSSRHPPARPGSPDAAKAPERNAFRRWWNLCLWFIALCSFPQAAFAQIRYTNTTDGTVNETVTPCTTPLVRNFTVSEIYTVADVNIGVLMSHTYRGDLQFYLQSPVGTRVQLINNIGTTRDNVNVLFDDAAANPISNHTANNDTATAATVVPAYQRTFRPFQALSAFNGQEAAGTWRLEICDSLNADSGTFFQSDLFLTAAPASVGVTKISSVISDGISGANPKALPGATVRYCITISNAGAGTAANISATDAIPANMTYVAGSMLSGSTCVTAATLEDDNATGADETDPIGASFSAGTITVYRASLLSASSFALLFNATVN